MDQTSGQPWLSFYGDDLTGSTDAMEALGLQGVHGMLFVRIPSAAERDRFGTMRAIGLAGTSRSQPPDWMDENLPRAFAWLREQEAQFCHYKVCSTFDSAPGTGSIGRAADIGAAVFRAPFVPVVVGVPQLRRYTFFGHLFAAYRGEIYRLDCHPVMSRHPVTPMTEADLRRHLSGQTKRTIGLVDLPTLGRADVDTVTDEIASTHDIVLFDVADDASQFVTGLQLSRLQSHGVRFVVGSSGVEYALLRAWAQDGRLGSPPAFPSPGAVERMAVVSGSVSPTTARQIEHACAHGFDLLALEPNRLVATEGISDAVERALRVLDQGRSVILATAQGPDTARVLGEDVRHEIGRRLGVVLSHLVSTAGLRRAVVAGGDTSSHALQELGVLALSLCLPLPKTPGSPLCQSHRPDGGMGPQLAFKGGQIGTDDYFVAIRDGRG